MSCKKSILIALMLVLSLLVSNAYAFSEGSGIKLNKDETIYTMLNYDGSVKEQKVINHFFEIKENTVTDYGSYLKVRPLKRTPQPKIEKNKTIWDTSDYIGKDFYYEGLINKELPFDFKIKYYLNNKLINADKLAGQEGIVKIVIDVTKNENCNEIFQSNYMAQITFKLDLDNIKIASQNGGINTVVGKYSTLTYAVMQSQSKTIELVLKAKKFSLEPINIAIIKSSLGNYGIGDMASGISDLREGSLTLVKGSKTLNDGIVDLSRGIEDLAVGVSDLSNGLNDLDEGLSKYKEGLVAYKNGVVATTKEVNNLGIQLDNINDQGNVIAKGYDEIYAGMKGIGDSQLELIKLANELIDSSDPRVQNLAKGVLANNAKIKQMTSVLKKSNEGLKAFTDGVDNITKGLTILNKGAGALPVKMNKLIDGYIPLYKGYTDVNKGLKGTKNGINKMSKEVRAIPTNISKLINGQEKIANGIVEFSDNLESTFVSNKKEEIVSFVESSLQVNTVSFVLKTPPIEETNDKSTNIYNNSKRKQSWYVKLWRRFLDLFN
ncbi:hypothetical protein PV797_01460 [Clostridiaceae bacterium M8S5]|nr:hypothetical protein PV797_01460 [Clostridiaceae bacterium M8S5]